jgi:hypothetical protein
MSITIEETDHSTIYRVDDDDAPDVERVEMVPGTVPTEGYVTVADGAKVWAMTVQVRRVADPE